LIEANEIEWVKYPVSDKTLTVQEAAAALAAEQSTFGYGIWMHTPSGEARVLVGGVWQRIAF
jgi:hypothetical protein